MCVEDSTRRSPQNHYCSLLPDKTEKALLSSPWPSMNTGETQGFEDRWCKQQRPLSGPPSFQEHKEECRLSPDGFAQLAKNNIPSSPRHSTTYQRLMKVFVTTAAQDHLQNNDSSKIQPKSLPQAGFGVVGLKLATWPHQALGQTTWIIKPSSCGYGKGRTSPMVQGPWEDFQDR